MKFLENIKPTEQSFNKAAYSSTYKFEATTNTTILASKTLSSPIYAPDGTLVPPMIGIPFGSTVKCTIHEKAKPNKWDTTFFGIYKRDEEIEYEFYFRSNLDASTVAEFLGLEGYKPED